MYNVNTCTRARTAFIDWKQVFRKGTPVLCHIASLPRCQASSYMAAEGPCERVQAKPLMSLLPIRKRDRIEILKTDGFSKVSGLFNDFQTGRGKPDHMRHIRTFAFGSGGIEPVPPNILRSYTAIRAGGYVASLRARNALGKRFRFCPGRTRCRKCRRSRWPHHSLGFSSFSTIGAVGRCTGRGLCGLSWSGQVDERYCRPKNRSAAN